MTTAVVGDSARRCFAAGNRRRGLPNWLGQTLASLAILICCTPTARADVPNQLIYSVETGWNGAVLQTTDLSALCNQWVSAVNAYLGVGPAYKLLDVQTRPTPACVISV